MHFKYFFLGPVGCSTHEEEEDDDDDDDVDDHDHHHDENDGGDEHGDDGHDDDEDKENDDDGDDNHGVLSDERRFARQSRSTHPYDAICIFHLHQLPVAPLKE